MEAVAVDTEVVVVVVRVVMEAVRVAVLATPEEAVALKAAAGGVRLVL